MGWTLQRPDRHNKVYPREYPGMQPQPPGRWLAEASFPPGLMGVSPLLSPFNAYLSITHCMPEALLGDTREQNQDPHPSGVRGPSMCV